MLLRLSWIHFFATIERWLGNLSCMKVRWQAYLQQKEEARSIKYWGTWWHLVFRSKRPRKTYGFLRIMLKTWHSHPSLAFQKPFFLGPIILRFNARPSGPSRLNIFQSDHKTLLQRNYIPKPIKFSKINSLYLLSWFQIMASCDSLIAKKCTIVQHLTYQ